MTAPRTTNTTTPHAMAGTFKRRRFIFSWCVGSIGRSFSTSIRALVSAPAADAFMCARKSMACRRAVPGKRGGKTPTSWKPDRAATRTVGPRCLDYKLAIRELEPRARAVLDEVMANPVHTYAVANGGTNGGTCAWTAENPEGPAKEDGSLGRGLPSMRTTALRERERQPLLEWQRSMSDGGRSSPRRGSSDSSLLMECSLRIGGTGA